jgi:hypothetical protein
MTDIVLDATDRELCGFMAALLMGLVDPGRPRERAGERLLACYRGYIAAAHPGADPAVLDEMALRFGGALLLEMERVGLAYATRPRRGTPDMVQVR